MSAPAITGLPTRAAYRVSTTHSSARFRARGLFGLPVRGQIPIRSGAVRIENGRARVSAELDVAGIDTGIRKRDADLRSARLLDAERFPALSFAGELSADLSLVPGTLTVRDQEVPVTLEIREVRRNADGVHVVATVRLDRQECGVKAPRVMIQRFVDVELTVRLVTGH